MAVVFDGMLLDSLYFFAFNLLQITASTRGDKLKVGG